MMMMGSSPRRFTLRMMSLRKTTTTTTTTSFLSSYPTLLVPSCSFHHHLHQLSHLSPFNSPPTSTQPYPPLQASALDSHLIPHKPGGPIDLYNQSIAIHRLSPDVHQLSIVRQLQVLYDALATYTPQPILDPPHDARSSWLNQFFSPLKSFSWSANRQPVSIPPPGIYLHGTVGTGKSMLMDLFYDSLPNLPLPSLGAKRIHFHEFMRDVHERMHVAQLRIQGQPDVLVGVAREIAREGRVLCFDEFQVTDIVDAMILKRLLECLLAQGVVCVMTSNRHPDDLYKNGLQRASFLPCIDLLKARFSVVDLNSGLDYRKRPRLLSKVYFSPLDLSHRSEFDKLFDALTDAEPVLENRLLHVWGRTIGVPRSTSSVARFSFEKLCGSPLSAADYIEIVSRFETIFIDGIPKLSLSQRDMARRFILFLDAAYENKTKLFTLSEVPIFEVFSGDQQSSQSSGGGDKVVSSEMRAAMDDLGHDLTTINSSSLFSGEEETFAWARAVSRLSEMGTLEWSQKSAGKKRGTGSDENVVGVGGGNQVVGASDLVKGMEGNEAAFLAQ